MKNKKKKIRLTKNAIRLIGATIGVIEAIILWNKPGFGVDHIIIGSAICGLIMWAVFFLMKAWLDKSGKVSTGMVTYILSFILVTMYYSAIQDASFALLNWRIVLPLVLGPLTGYGLFLLFEEFTASSSTSYYGGGYSSGSGSYSTGSTTTTYSPVLPGKITVRDLGLLGKDITLPGGKKLIPEEDYLTGDTVLRDKNHNKVYTIHTDFFGTDKTVKDKNGKEIGKYRTDIFGDDYFEDKNGKKTKIDKKPW